MNVTRHRHSRFAELREAFRHHPEWFGPWSGLLFRFQTVEFPLAKDILSGQGAAGRGGRWNPRGLATLYGSTTDTTALEECKANDRYYGVVTKGPRLLVAIEAQLQRVLDLNDSGLRRALDLNRSDLAAEDWRKLQFAGEESLTQAIGRAVAEARGSGILAPSVTLAHGVTVAIYPGICPGDQLQVVEGDKLDRIGVRKKG